MSVLGFDFGNESCIVAVARQRGIDIVLNDESKRETPAIVCFGDKQCFIGTAGAASTMMNPKNSISQIKRLIGRQFSDPELQQDLKSLPFNVTEGPGGYPLIHVRYMGEDKTFTPTQVFGMMLSNLKEIAQKDLNAAVVDCCIGIPVYFTDLQRRAVLDAASIAGLHPLRLFHETTATALAYGIYKTDLPENDQLNVAFVDIGHASMQVCIAGFKKGQLKVLAHSYDRSLGGRDFDEVLFHHFAAKFKDEYKIDVFQNARACLRLRAACEKLKKVLSANPEAPLNIECLVGAKDVRGFIKRDEFEQLSLPILERVKGPLEKALAEADLTVENVHVVEVVGSGSRVPAINKILTEFFKKKPRRAMNASEYVAKGCALQCAILSPTFKVREFQVNESLPFSISLSWKGSGPDEHESEPDNQLSTVVFPKGNPIPSLKLLTFYRIGTFSVDVQYGDASVVQAPAKISTYTIGPFQTTKGERAKVKVRVRLNVHGIVSVDSATLLEGGKVKVPVSKESTGENTKMDTDEAPSDAAAPPTSNDTDANMLDAKASADTPGAENGIPEAGDKPVQMDPDTKKQSTKAAELPKKVTRSSGHTRPSYPPPSATSKRKTRTPMAASGISSLADHVIMLDEASNVEATVISTDSAEEANVTPVQPIQPPSISTEDLAKYFNNLVVALPGESSSTEAVCEVIANILDMEAIPNLATLNILQENLSCIANSTDDNVLESTKNLHNEMGMLLVDMNHHLEVGRQRINRSEHKLARLTDLSNQKQKLTLAFIEQENRRVEDLKKHQTTTQRIAFLKTSIAQMEAELQTLLPQEISLSQQLKQTQSEQFQLYAQATVLDKEIKSLTLQKQYLEKNFIDGQQQLYKADLLWKEICFKLLADKELSKDIITIVSDSATEPAQDVFDTIIPKPIATATGSPLSVFDPKAAMHPVVAIASEYAFSSPNKHSTPEGTTIKDVPGETPDASASPEIEQAATVD